MPVGGGYWLPRPARIASAAASAMERGPAAAGEPLAEVDRGGGEGAGRHLAEDRVAEAVQAAVEQRSSHQIRLRRSGLGWAGAYRVVSNPGERRPGRQPVAGARRAAGGRR